MNENVVPFKKVDRFLVYLGEVSEDGVVSPKAQVGMAFLSQRSSTFRLKMWLFPKEQLFLTANDDRTKYRVLCLDESIDRQGQTRTYWNEVGLGEVAGSFIRLKFHLLEVEVYVSLFPAAAKEEVGDAAA